MFLTRVDRKKGGSFNIMYSLGLLIVELETSRRRLLEVFEVPDVNEQMDLERRQFPMGYVNRPLDASPKPPIGTFSMRSEV